MASNKSSNDLNRISSFLGLLGLAVLVAPASGQTLGGCNMFPANNVWNAPVDKLPVDPNSSAYISTIGSSTGLHPDFSSSGGGIPYTVVPASQPRVSVSFAYPDESDPGPYPVPANAAIEAASDQHVLVLDQGSCKLYELYNGAVNSNGTWTANSGAVFDLNSNLLRPSGWTSSDAAGLPVLPGLVRYDEVMSGHILHALRITAPQTRDQFIWPARHQASSLSGTQYPPLGQRFRLKATFDVTPYPMEVQVILNALKTYGAILADNGSSWYVSGVPDSRWNDSNLHALSGIIGSNLEAVNESGLQVSPNSGAVAGGPAGLTGIYLDQRDVSAGTTVNAQAILTAPAPAGGAAVAITSSNSAAVTAPSAVTVPAGSVSVNVPITIKSISSTTPVVLTSGYKSVAQPSPVLFVSGTSGTTVPMLSALSASLTTVAGGSTLTGTVRITAPAPAGGVAIGVNSANPAVLSVPATVTVPAAATSASFIITAQPQTANSTETIATTLNGEKLSIPITVTAGSSASAALNSVVLSAGTVLGGGNVTGTVSLTGLAPAGGLDVSLLSSNTSVATVPSHVLVPATKSSATFTVATYKQTTNETAQITASLNGISKTASLTATSAPVTPVSVFASTAVPGTPSDSDSSSVELGMKFKSSVAGQVTGIRFYKGANNTGTHTGHLWSAGGMLLASVTFVNETASGWQQAIFSSPVAIQANTVYVVSYHAPNGHYADDENFFASSLNSASLQALQDGSDGPNGTYTYGSIAFPTQGWNASNYWVDVLFVP